MSAGIDTIRVILPRPQIVRINNVTVTGNGGNLSVIDLGMVSLRDVAINGRSVPLVPYAEGRLISCVRFLPGGIFNTNSQGFYFYTPNTAGQTGSANNGMAALGVISDTGGIDTLGLIAAGNQTDVFGGSSAYSQILDCGPLIAGFPQTAISSLPSWQADTIYSDGDAILDPSDHIQFIQITGNGGVSGSEPGPTWDDSGGTTSDGTVTWTDTGLVPSGEIHTIVEVIEGINPMPPYPATLEFVDQPTDVVAGEAMDDITVIVKDQHGDPYSFYGVYIQLALHGAGTLAGGTGTVVVGDDETGIATFSGLTITEPGTGYVIRARRYPSLVETPIFSDPFDVTAP